MKVGEGLRMVQPRPPAAALGMAVQYLASDPAFGGLPFGSWSKVLIGQINRGHYGVTLDEAGRIQGFMGWALASETGADAWLRGEGLSYADSLDGDCVVFNAWMASTPAAQRFMVREARRVLVGRRAFYWRRRYGSGPLRAFKQAINGRVLERHLARNAPQA